MRRPHKHFYAVRFTEIVFLTIFCCAFFASGKTDSIDKRRTLRCLRTKNRSEWDRNVMHSLPNMAGNDISFLIQHTVATNVLRCVHFFALSFQQQSWLRFWCCCCDGGFWLLFAANARTYEVGTMMIRLKFINKNVQRHESYFLTSRITAFRACAFDGEGNDGAFK